MPLFGPKFPLSAGTRDTFELYDDVKQQINFYLKNLILTSPGENISDPNYGVGLRRFLFDQNTEATRATIEASISSQISKYLPYLSVEDIQTGADAEEIDNNSMFVRVIYSIPDAVTREIFELDLSPDTTIGYY